MILMIDNYDSFTYNLVQYLQILGLEVSVYYHDAITLEAIADLQPSHIVISPGPNAPEDAGISLSVIQHFYQTIPMLGVCLGHQCLAQAFGGTIVQAPQIMHGKTSPIYHQGLRLFQNLPPSFLVTRYHSLAVEKETLPTCFHLDAWTDDTIMAISHKQYPLFGVQFHPEAILSEHGLQLLSHFIQYGFKTCQKHEAMLE